MNVVPFDRTRRSATNIWPTLLTVIQGDLNTNRFYEVWLDDGRMWWRDLYTDELIPIPTGVAVRFFAQFQNRSRLSLLDQS